MTYDDVVQVLAAHFPGSEWSYDGDGTSLDPVTDQDGTLVSRGLEWHDETTTAPSLPDLEAALSQVQADAKAAALATAWAELRKVRDRWLNECQYVLDHAEGASTRTLSTAAAIDANADAWLEWRKAMLDLPATIGAKNDPRPALAALAAASIDSTADAFPAPWPQPPTAPVVHLT